MEWSEISEDHRWLREGYIEVYSLCEVYSLVVEDKCAVADFYLEGIGLGLFLKHCRRRSRVSITRFGLSEQQMECLIQEAQCQEDQILLDVNLRASGNQMK